MAFANAFLSNDRVSELVGAIESAEGCRLPAVGCSCCSGTHSAQFHQPCNDEDIGWIEICENNAIGVGSIAATLIHELTHAYDHCFIDWENVYEHACSEIRAANYSGDCRPGGDFYMGGAPWFESYTDCIKRTASQSIESNPNLFGRNALDVVNAMFNACFAAAPPNQIPL